MLSKRARRAIRRRLDAATRWIDFRDRPEPSPAPRRPPLVGLLDELWSRARRWLPLAAAAAVMLAAAWLFGGIAEDVVTGDPLTIVDRWLADWLHHHATPGLTRVMRVLTELGGSALVTTAAVGTALCLLWRRRWHWLLALVLAVPGGLLVNMLLKLAFRRARPTLDVPTFVPTDYGFPSGHTMTATLLYGFLAAFALGTVRGWRSRVLAALGAGVLVVCVALSRIYLGAHYLSDALAAVAAGVAWLAACLTGVALLRCRARGR